ncbi:MAG: hypothetical protein ABI767_07140 [Rhodanobacter sp.]
MLHDAWLRRHAQDANALGDASAWLVNVTARLARPAPGKNAQVTPADGCPNRAQPEVERSVQRERNEYPYSVAILINAWGRIAIPFQKAPDTYELTKL